MRISFFFLTALLVLSSAPHAGAQSTFTTNLSLGSAGPQVMALQKILNQDPATRIASTGPGSPGNETERFGALTRAAVIKFQEKYASEVLAPAGLAQGNGRVGFYTQTKLNMLSVSTVSAPSTISTTPSIPAPISTPSPTVPASTTTSQNPNLKNLDIFLADVEKVSTKQGVSSTTIATMKQQILRDIATTTDLRATFLKMVQSKPKQSLRDYSFTGGVLATITQAFDKIFMPERARAAAATVPFGGALLFTFPCCGTWLLTLEPLPPSYAVLLTYTPFSQAFLSYNIPFTTWLLGEYEPGAGICQTGNFCAQRINSEGMITPMVGSSAI